MSHAKTWPEFEQLMEKLQRVFFPNSTVQRNVRIHGQHSRRMREIDIAIRQKVGIQNLLIIVECKQWRRKIDVKAVEAFASVRQDVGAHMAMMIASEGFSRSAKHMADAKQISLYTYRDTRQDDWPNGLIVPVVHEQWTLKLIAFYIMRSSGERENLTSDLILDLHDNRTGKEMLPSGICQRLWAEQAKKIPGRYCWEFPCSTGDSNVLNDKLGLGFETFLRTTSRVGRLYFTGLVDQASGYAIAPGFRVEIEDPPVEVVSQAVGLKEHFKFALVMESIAMETVDRKAQKAQELISEGHLYLEVKTNSSMTIPIKAD
jgi:hypothetical protein